MLLIILRSEWGHSVDAGGGATFCGGRRQGWRLDPSAQEPGGGGICANLLHQSLPGQQRQRCHDLHMTSQWPLNYLTWHQVGSHDLRPLTHECHHASSYGNSSLPCCALPVCVPNLSCVTYLYNSRAGVSLRLTSDTDDDQFSLCNANLMLTWKDI